MNRDPIGYRGSKWNLYEYVASNPTRYVDPSGKGGLATIAAGFAELIMNLGCANGTTTDESCLLCCSVAAAAAHTGMASALAFELGLCPATGPGAPFCVAAVLTDYGIAMANITDAILGCVDSCEKKCGTCEDDCADRFDWILDRELYLSCLENCEDE